MTWHPSEDDLAPWSARALEEAYRTRHRPKCSREDFGDGWMAALVWARSRSSFKPERWEPSGDAGGEDA